MGKFFRPFLFLAVAMACHRPLPASAQTTVTGVVAFQDISSLTAGDLSGPFTIEFRPPGLTPAVTNGVFTTPITVSSGGIGTFSVTGTSTALPAGLYDVAIFGLYKNPVYGFIHGGKLIKNVSVPAPAAGANTVAISTATTTPPLTLQGFNIITFALFKNAYNLAYDASMDLNNDNSIDPIDFGIFVSELEL